MNNAMRRFVPIAAIATSLAVLSCAQAAVAPRIVTMRHNGDAFTMRKGAHRQLH